MRGKSKNKTTMIGVPSSAIRAAIVADCHSGAGSTGRWLLTRAVSRPQRPISIITAVSRLCE